LQAWKTRRDRVKTLPARWTADRHGRYRWVPAVPKRQPKTSTPRTLDPQAARVYRRAQVQGKRVPGTRGHPLNPGGPLDPHPQGA